jgi:hypothetical protein
MMGYYNNLPSFEPFVDPNSFGGGRMSPADRATMNMRMDRAVPDAEPAPKALPLKLLPLSPNNPMRGLPVADSLDGETFEDPSYWNLRIQPTPTRPPAITSSFPVLRSRDTPPALPVPQPDVSYGQPPAVMQPVDSTPSAFSRYAGDIAGKTFLPYVQSAITNAQEGNYARAAGSAAGAVKQAVWDAPLTAIGGVANEVGAGYNEFKQGAGIGNTPFKTAFASYVRPNEAAPAATNTPAATPPAANAAGRPVVAPVLQNGQRLSELYPERFKGVPKFSEVVAGGANNPYKLPLTTAEQNYNAQVQRSMELENRARELSNVDRYRATQLHDRNAMAALEATRGGPGDSNRGIVREEYDPRYVHYPKEGNTAEDKADMISQREKAVQEALFDPAPGIPNDIKIANARRRYPDLVSAYLASGKQSPYADVEDYISKLTGMTYNGKYFTSGQ